MDSGQIGWENAMLQKSFSQIHTMRHTFTKTHLTTPSYLETVQFYGIHPKTFQFQETIFPICDLHLPFSVCSACFFGTEIVFKSI